jgi:hypothetical protein
MPITVEEFIRSPRITGDFHQSTREMAFKIRGTTDPEAAYAALIATAPASVTVDGFILSKRVFTVDYVDLEVFDGTVTYSKKSLDNEELQQGESSYQFETGGGTKQVSYALATTKYPASAPDMANAVNFDGEKINGVEVQAPVFNFSETHVLPAATVTGAYKLALFNATGKVNGGPFKGFAQGEVLFLGASGSKRGDDDWEIAFRFAASPNAAGLSVTGVSVASKRGWEYLWVNWCKEVDGATNALKPKAAGVYVQQVYEYADFSTLGIGT